MALALIFAGFMTYIEEKNKCKHIWKETNRTMWNKYSRYSGESVGEVIKVELTCSKCGNIKVMEI